tara:strand:+ start:20361 stop:20987 length:627 start_codon:yes stop_codon:yes gene_type:complete
MRNIKIIDNFLNKEDLCSLLNQLKNKKTRNFKILHNTIDSRNKIIDSAIEKKLIYRLQKRYFPKASKILKKLSPKKLQLYNFSDFTIIITNKNKKFPIHDDTPDKILSGVVYLYPKNNSGTIFYSNKKGENKKKIKWKINRAVFFSRLEKQTWHSYQGNGKSDRIALVFNLKTKNIKKVFEIEKKNFILGYLRYKLNPYLFKFFKYTI